MRHRRIAILAIPLLLGPAACVSEPAESADVLTIGVAQPLSGPVASAGQAVRHGAEIAAAEINAAGGVNGTKIKLQIEDGANDPATCVNVAQSLVNRSQVPVVMGGWGSSCTLAMQPVLERAQVPLLVETSSSDKVTDKGDSGGDWTFRISPTSSMEAAALRPVLKDMNIKRAFTLSVNNDFGLGAAQHYGEDLTDLGAKVVGGAKFDQTEQSFAGVVTQAIASGADTWIVTSDAAQIALLLKEAKGQGAKARIITTGGSNSPTQVLQLAGKAAAEGSFATMFFPVFDPSKAAAPDQAKKFIKSWREKRYDEGEITEGVRGYQGIKVIAEAMRSAEDPKDPKAIRDALAKVNVPGAIYGDISFQNWNNLVNQAIPPVYLVRTNKSEIELVGTGNPPY
ncbi:MAG: ABC transporter substrate-binding protein [Pseudonocardiaceae bacterium]|nr:ABC transporter substrate-binding protein [Pseudonocardiaceae bacterium]